MAGIHEPVGHRGGADLNLVTVPQGDPLGDGLPVQLCSVLAAQVLDGGLTIGDDVAARWAIPQDGLEIAASGGEDREFDPPSARRGAPRIGWRP
jgi:hypothetical protein